MGKIKTIYDSNETMKMIGQQCSYELIRSNETIYKQFMDVLKAHQEHQTKDITEIGIDFYTLGIMAAKQMEPEHQA